MARKFDELNVIEYDTYFGEMELSEEEKQRRIKLAETFEILFLYYFTLYLEDNKKSYIKMIEETYRDISIEFLEMDYAPEYIEKRAKEVANDVDRVTRENGNNQYYTSGRRAKNISANETNVIANYRLQIEAIRNGMRYKTWKTMKDKRVRHSHILVDERKIGIFDEFEVGTSRMMYPNDTSLGASPNEIINCRCVVKYSDK